MKSNSQLGQDLWVLNELNRKKDGFFVEAGACDGVWLSNTLLLEREFNWNGICCEPNPTYFDKLKTNRNCIVDDRCLYSTTGEKIQFFCSPGRPWLGGTEDDFIVEHDDEVDLLKIRKSEDPIEVSTVSLNDLLSHHSAPHVIDYISLDTEGSEMKIIKGLDFQKYQVKLWTIEHNSNRRSGKDNHLNDMIQFFADRKYDHVIREHDIWFKKLV